MDNKACSKLGGGFRGHVPAEELALKAIEEATR